MSVIQRIRDKGAWIVFGVIALALVAFILQDGVRRGGSMFSNSNALGKVNGDVITRTDFEQKIAMYSRNGEDREQTMGKVWEQEVFNLIMTQQFDKLGIAVGQKELSDILYGENSPFRQQLTDPKTGVFDVERLRARLAQIKKSKNEQEKAQVSAMIDDAVLRVKQTKYQGLLQHSVYAPKWMIEKEAADNNGVSSVSYVSVPYSAIPDASVKVSDDDIMAYAKKYRSKFERDDETRSLVYVSFNAAAGAADSAATVNQLMLLKPQFDSASSMKTFFATNSSETQYYDGYISKKEIKHKFIDSIVKVGTGNIYGPYVDGGNFVLAKIAGEKQMPDSVKIRHILIATHQQNQETGALERIREDSTARKIMDTVEAEIKSGKNFDSVCLKYSDDGTKTSGGVYDYFPSGRMVPEFNDFVFGNGTGAKGVVKTDFGYHYIEILGQRGSGPAYKIAYLSKPIVVSSETDNAASSAAAQFASMSRNRKNFEANAAKIGKMSVPSGDLKENDFTVSGLNSSARQMVRWLYEHKTGDVADQVFRIGDKYVVPMVTSVIKPGLPPAVILRPQIEPLVRNEKKAKQIIETKIKGSTLEAIASSAGTAVQKNDSILFNSPFINGLAGMELKFTGAAFNTTLKGKVSEPIAGENAVFVLRVENITSKPATDSPDAVKSTIMQMQQLSIYRGTEGLKKVSKIRDYRSKFY